MREKALGYRQRTATVFAAWTLALAGRRQAPWCRRLGKPPSFPSESSVCGAPAPHPAGFDLQVDSGLSHRTQLGILLLEQPVSA